MVKKLHLGIGISGLIIFALTGLYMDRVLGLPSSEFDVQRMMYRASHIYLLLVSCGVLLVGCYWQVFTGLAKKLQVFGSVLMWAAFGLLLAAFFSEPANVDEDRLFTFLGCVLFLGGTGITFIASYFNARAVKSPVK